MDYKKGFSKIKHMWICTMFDLATHTLENKRDYTQFRKLLLSEGFSMLQYSVYARFCKSRSHADTFARRIELALPPEGQVRILYITDKQFGDMKVFMGISGKIAPEKPPEQLLLF